MELRYGLLRDILECRVPMTETAMAQILKLFPPAVLDHGIEAIDPSELQATLRSLAITYAAQNHLVLMLSPEQAIPITVKPEMIDAVDTLSMIARCADYARRAQTASPEAQAHVIARLATELAALVPQPL